MKHTSVIAIDGPSGSGKSTLAKLLAKRLEVLYIDTGSMYRALGLWAHRKSIDFNDHQSISKNLEKLDLKYAPRRDVLIELDGEDLTESIRDHQVSFYASEISQVPVVREYLLDIQRSLVDENVCVMEGRDIGTVVFPDAFCKIFITADVRVRAKRRMDQLKESERETPDLGQVIKDIELRDEKDRMREYSPLRKADDAHEIDTSELNLDQVLDKLKDISCEAAIGQGYQLRACQL